MPQTITHKIQRGFSRSAKNYDDTSKLHREIADKLFSRVTGNPKPSSILDVGCGTGYLTVKLKEHFSQAKIIGLDFAQGMLDVAQSKHDGIDWILADGNNLPFSDGSFGILISNLVYQWAEDMSRVFAEARRVLTSDGILACTLFGYSTCQELFQSLCEAKDGALQFSRLPHEIQVSEALINAGFKDPQVDVEHIQIKFNDMHELMLWLKSIGANNLSREGFLGAEAMSRADAIYRRKFSYLQGVKATFEVIRVYVKK